MIGPNTFIFFISSLSALIYSGQVALVIQKINELFHWKYGCNPIYSVGNVSLHYFSGRGKAECIRLLMEDHKIPYTETKYSMGEASWPAARSVGIDIGLYAFGESILHYLGRSVGLDCDCNEIDWCDMIASGVDDLRAQLEDIVLKHAKFDSMNRNRYVGTTLLKWLRYFEKLAPSIDLYGEGVYFASSRLTWLDYSVFDMLESNCNLLDHREGIVIESQLNCTQVLELFPKLKTFYGSFKERPNINAYIHSESRPKFANPIWSIL